MATVLRVIGDFPSGLDVRTFHDELAAISFSSTPTAFLGLTRQTFPDEVRIEFSVALDATDTAALNAAILAHTNTPTTIPTEDQIVRDPQGGDLGGTLPNADVRALSDSALLSHPITTLNEGEYLRVVGGNITTAAVAGGSDELVGITASDTTPSYLNTKVVGGSGINTAVLNPAADEDLELSADFGTAAGTVCEGNDARLSDPRISPDHQSAFRTSIVSTTSTTAQIYLSLTTPVLNGTYAIQWSASISQEAGGNGLAEVFLERAGGPLVTGLEAWRRSSASEIFNVSHMTEQTISGVSHTYNIKFNTTNPSTTMNIFRGTIQIWKVA